MPSHRVASLANLTRCVLPTLTSRRHCRCFRLFEKSTASVLVSSNRTALLSAHVPQILWFRYSRWDPAAAGPNPPHFIHKLLVFWMDSM